MVENTNYENTTTSQYVLTKELGKGISAIAYEAERINAEGVREKFAIKVMTYDDPAQR